MNDRPPDDTSPEDDYGHDEPPATPPAGNQGDTFEREIEGELAELREQLAGEEERERAERLAAASEDASGDPDEFAPAPVGEEAAEAERADETEPHTEEFLPEGEEMPAEGEDDLLAEDEPGAEEAVAAPDAGESAAAGEPLAADLVAPAPGAPAAPAVAVPAAGGGPGTDIDLELESGRRPVAMWAKFLAGSMLIVMSIATAVSVTILLGLTDLAKGLQDPELVGIERGLQAVEGGDPQTILLIGSDQRPGEAGGRSDTAMLLRLDPDKDAIALFSLPRDLRVNIPGRGIDRLNAAYAYGGPKLALQTIQQVTGLKINHLVNIEFNGFAKAVDAIDCVYVDIDRDYFNANEGGGDRFAEIDVNAGYQRLCGFKALQFVRFRHTDNDIVRGARQQDFLREARQKVPTDDLIVGSFKIPGFRSSRGEELIEIFKDHTSSDINSAAAVLELLQLLIASRNAEVKEVFFEGQLGPTYVTASNEQMQRAVDDFLGVEDSAGPRGGKTGGKKAERAEAEAKRKVERKEKRKRERDPTAGVELVNSSEEGRRFAEIVDEAGTLNIPAKYPTRLPPGATISEDSRGYRIKDPDGIRHRSYKLVISMRGVGITEYFGVMGTPWKNPPILANPSEIREIEGTEYKLYYTGERLRMIAWETDQAVYWVNNTLLQSLSEAQMIAVATSMGSFR